MIIQYILVAIIGYLLGCSNMAVYISKIKKVDLKSGGSGNPGASNVTMLMGKKAGAIVAIHDIGKGIIAVLIATFVFKSLEYGTYVAGVAAILGHIYPFWMKFKGGKGFATYIGVSVALDWKVGLIILVIAMLIAWISDYIVMGTVSVIVANPIVKLCMGNIVGTVLMLIPTIIILYLHRSNIKKILNHTEPKIRKALKGDYKPKNEDS